MGLDMYLTKKTYIGNKYKKAGEMVRLGLPNIKDERVSEISESVGYWRKANQIHNWFVQNVQDGTDDCKDYYVSEENFKALLEVVNKVLDSITIVDGDMITENVFEKGKVTEVKRKQQIVKDSSVAEALLPTQSGFFYGSTGYDEYYVDDLKETKKIVEEALADEDGDYYYQSSW